MPTASSFPAFQLLLVLGFSLIIGLPLLIWLLMRRYRDQGARLWFLAVATNATAVCLVGYLARFHWVPAVLFLGAVLVGIEAMRWELGRQAAPRRLALAVFIAYAAFQLTLDQLGLRLSVGFIVNLSLLVLGEGVLIALVLQVSRLHDSRGLRMVALGIAPVGVINLIRLGQTLIVGQAPDAFSGAPATNIAILLVTLFSVLQVVGYGGFVMEKLYQRQLDNQLAEARATERRLLAERHAQDLEAVVRQRDDMIMLNSRYSSVNHMALYNSTIVHEISQPLQALMSILDGMKLRAESGMVAPDRGIDNAMTMVTKLSNTLNTLRGLMGRQPAAVERLNVDSVLAEILPIMQTQAQRHKVSLQHSSQVPPDTSVLVNRALLQRLIFNLVTNAFEALADMPDPAGRQIWLRTSTLERQGIGFCVLRVEDNGPGFPPGLKIRPGLSLQTTKELGLGLGLGFCKMVVDSWRGELLTDNRAPEDGGGAVVDVRIPLAGIALSSPA
jgi:signal transduction histidine kinase